MNEVVQTSPTIGSNVEEIIWKNIRFIMWDIGGQESLRSTWNSYYTNTKVWSYLSQTECKCIEFRVVSVLSFPYPVQFDFAGEFAVRFCGGFVVIV